MQSPAPVDRDPRIVLSPKDLHRAPDVAVKRFDLVGIGFVCLGELAIEAAAAFFGQPGVSQCRAGLGPDFVDKGAADIGIDNRAVDMRREPDKGFHMAADVIEELRPPGAEGNDVHQDVFLEIAAVQKMRPQRCCPAKVMGHDRGSFELPMIEHFGKDLALNVEGCALIR